MQHSTRKNETQNLEETMKLPMNRATGTSATHLRGALAQGALAMALSFTLLSACSKESEDLVTVEPPEPPQATQAPGTAVVNPEQEEAFSAQLHEPERDQSIDANASEASEMAQFAMIDMATVTIAPTAGHTASGTVRFRPANDQSAMLVLVDLEGLEPGQHGFHIHENGDCSAPDASSAGAHFNPYKTHHGGPDDPERHVGDLGNISADASGNARAEIVVKDLAFSGPASILQKAMVVHAKADDMTTDPSGGSGDRIGCGVIYQQPEVLAKPATGDADGG
jgi:Cu-Zn family superoxide dismutase